MKIKYSYKFIYGALLLGLLASSCDTDELHEININPQAVSQIDLNFLFSAAELGLADGGTSSNRYLNWRTNIGICGGAIQQLTTTGSISTIGNFYRDYEEGSQGVFQFTYQDQLKNIAEVLKQTGPDGYDAGNKVNMRNAARILRAWSFFRLTDFFGAVPYFEANQGIEGTFFPKYDKQSVIYPDLLRELDEAVAGMSTSNPDEGFAGADMIYNGDIAKWKKMGNSLMLRYAMRVSNVDAGMAATYVSKAVSGGVFTSNEDNLWIPHALGPSEWQNQNGLSRAFAPGDGGNAATLSKTLIDFLKGADPATVADDDPRLMIFSGGIAIWSATGWNPITTDPLLQQGVPPGFFQSDLEAIAGRTIFMDSTYSRINYLMLDDDDPYMLMNHAEVEFLMAEAIERGIGSVPGTAKDHYEAGVKSAMQMYTPFDELLTVSDEEVATYLATYPYGSRNAQEMIGEQMWVSKFLNWWESWCDWRRSGYPVLVAHTNDESNVTNGQIPVRLRYPNTEVAANPNFDQQNFNNYTSKVWWDGGTE
ncbi:MAG: SusD/RagB family nutrient-binding outer membrane lipoprotein [Saprospiraceae bacterium]|nr:SusD/RagB family nutrient-binding outer membrane lipoprotein [Saprospiraceae bacterium]